MRVLKEVVFEQQLEKQYEPGYWGRRTVFPGGGNREQCYVFFFIVTIAILGSQMGIFPSSASSVYQAVLSYVTWFTTR